MMTKLVSPICFGHNEGFKCNAAANGFKCPRGGTFAAGAKAEIAAGLTARTSLAETLVTISD